MKIFERIKRKYTNGDPSSAEKTGIQKKKYHMVTHFTRCCGKEKRMLLISFGVEMESCPGTSGCTYVST